MEVNPKRGYCQLTIGGKKRTLHFSMNFWVVFEKESGHTIAELDKVFGNNLSIAVIRAIFYSGLIAFDQEEKNEIDYDAVDVGNWLEDITTDEFQMVVNTMLESKLLGNSLNAGVRRHVTKSSKSPK